MSTPVEPPITLTSDDALRIRALIDSYGTARDADAVDALENELGRAHVVEPGQLPPGVVAVHSTVTYADARGQERRVTLVWPREADANTGRVSVLAPIGAALIGMRVGQSIRWSLPRGRVQELRVLRVEDGVHASSGGHGSR